MKTKDLQGKSGEISPTYDASTCILEALKEPQGEDLKGSPFQRAVSVDSVDAARRLLTRTLTQLQKGMVSPHYAKAISYVLRGFVHLTEAGELEKRIKALEETNTQRKEKEHPR